MNFIMQNKPTNCAPVAIYNMMQWAGVSVSLKHFEKLMKCNSKKGVCDADIKRAIESISAEYISDSSFYASVFWDDIKRKLDNNTALYLGYRNENNPNKKRNTSGHAVLLFTQSGKYYIVNDKMWDLPTLLIEASPEHLENLTKCNARGYFVRRTNEN